MTMIRLMQLKINTIAEVDVFHWKFIVNGIADYLWFE